MLKDIAFIDAIVIDAPFIIYPKKNTRDGIFKEVFSGNSPIINNTCYIYFNIPINISRIYIETNFTIIIYSRCI